MIEKSSDKSFSTSIDSKIKALDAEQREYERLNDGAISYESKLGRGVELNLQGVSASGDEIKCRHLVGYLMQGPGIKNYHADYATLDSIEAIPYLKEGTFDKERVDLNSSYYMFTSIDEGFGAALTDIASELNMGEEARFHMDSEGHAMAMTIAKKPLESGSAQYVVKFYDPDNTDIHKRMIFPSLDSLGKLYVQDFMENDEDLFKANRVVALYSPKPAGEEGTLVDTFHGNDIKGILYHSLRSNAPEGVKRAMQVILDKPDTSHVRELGVSSSQGDRKFAGFKVLNMTLIDGAFESASAYMDTVINSPTLSPSEKKQLLEAKNEGSDKTALHAALCSDDVSKAVNLYVNAVSSSSLEQQDKVSLLQSESEGLSITAQLISKKDVSGLNIYLNAIAQSGLPPESLKAILQSGAKRGSTLFAIQKDCPECIGVYMDVVLTSQLPLDDKVQMLKGCNGRNIPGLRVACNQGNEDVALAIAKKIACSDLPLASKKELFSDIPADCPTGSAVQEFLIEHATATSQSSTAAAMTTGAVVGEEVGSDNTASIENDPEDDGEAERGFSH